MLLQRKVRTEITLGFIWRYRTSHQEASFINTIDNMFNCDAMMIDITAFLNKSIEETYQRVADEYSQVLQHIY